MSASPSSTSCFCPALSGWLLSDLLRSTISSTHSLRGCTLLLFPCIIRKTSVFNFLSSVIRHTTLCARRVLCSCLRTKYTGHAIVWGRHCNAVFWLTILCCIHILGRQFFFFLGGGEWPQFLNFWHAFVNLGHHQTRGSIVTINQATSEIRRRKEDKKKNTSSKTEWRVSQL